MPAFPPPAAVGEHYLRAANVIEEPGTGDSDAAPRRPVPKPPHDPTLTEAQIGRFRHRAELATRIMQTADTPESRLGVLDAMIAKGETTEKELGFLRGQLEAQLSSAPTTRVLPASEIEFALKELGVLEEENSVLTPEERARLDRDGFLNLGQLLSEAQVQEMRTRVDEQVEREGQASGTEAGGSGVGGGSQQKGVVILTGTVLKPMNHDGLFNVVFSHPRLLAAARHFLGTDFKISATNVLCPLPGYGHQLLHCDWGYGVPAGEYQVVNSTFLLDDFTPESGATRVVPGSHKSGQHPVVVMDDTSQPHPHEVQIIGKAGDCFVFCSHVWHAGTLNRSSGVRRGLFSQFTRSHNVQQNSAQIGSVSPEVYARLSRTERAILDMPKPEENNAKL